MAYISIDTKDAISSALLRSEQAPALSRTALDFISKDEWKNMDCSRDKILVEPMKGKDYD